MHKQKPGTEDISLFKLTEKIDFEGKDKHLRQVCMPPKGTDFSNMTCVAVGWGSTRLGGPTPNILRKVKLPITDNKLCAEENKAIMPVRDGQICAGGVEESKGICNGDSGGPLLCQMKDNQWFQVGISSWSKPCAHKGFPAVFTRVSEYQDWINQKIANN
jgi:secreted trypsin-like serine protease